MFKNLDGFKKVKEDKDVTVMQHPKGHTISIAMNSLPAMHKRQLKALPMACGGPVKMASGGEMINLPEASGGSSLPESIPSGVQASRPDSEIQPGFVKNPAAFGDFSGNQPEVIPDPNALPPKGTMIEIPEGAKAESSAEDGADEADASAAPESGPAKGQAQAGISPMSAYNLQASALQDSARAQKQQNAEERSASIEYQNDYAEAASRWDRNQAQMAGQIKSALKDVQDGHINPRQYQESMSSGQRVAAALGLFLGGFSTPFTHQGNPALEMLNKQIDRDIDSQKAGLNNKMNIYHAYLDQYKNAAAAESMTRATMLGVYGQKLKMAALNNADPQIQARLKMGLGQIQQAIVPQLLQAQLFAEGAKFNNSNPNAGQGSEADYNHYLNSAQQINPQLWKDAQSKYIPGVGTTAIPVKHEDIEALSTLKNLNDVAKEAQDFAQTQGPTMYGTSSNQRANDMATTLRLQMGKLVKLNRMTEVEYHQFENMIRSPGSWNSPAAIQSFKDFRKDVAGKVQSLGDQYKIKPFRR